jgi:WD40 repeat protein
MSLSFESFATLSKEECTYQGYLKNWLFNEDFGTRHKQTKLQQFRKQTDDKSPVKMLQRGVFKKRKITLAKARLPKDPIKVLDSPNFVDDFYLNLLDWGSRNLISIALSNTLYLWDASNCKVTEWCKLSNSALRSNYFTSVKFSPNSAYLASATSESILNVWDVTSQTVLSRNVVNIEEPLRLPVVQWLNQRSLAVGQRNGNVAIYHDIIRQQRTTRIELNECHSQEVCSIEISPNGNYLATGANDNLVHIWDLRFVKKRLSTLNHNAAVKVRKILVSNSRR